MGGVFHGQPCIGLPETVERPVDVRRADRRPQENRLGGQKTPEHTRPDIRIQSLDCFKILTCRKIRVKNPIHELVIPRAEIQIEMVVDDAAIQPQPEFVTAVATDVFDVRQRQHRLHGTVVHIAGLVAVEREPESQQLLPSMVLIDRTIDLRAHRHERLGNRQPLRAHDDSTAHHPVESCCQCRIHTRRVGVKLGKVVILGESYLKKKSQCCQQQHHIAVFLVPATSQIPAQLVLAWIVLRFIEFRAGNLLRHELLIHEIMFEIVGILVTLVVTELLHQLGRGVADVHRHGQVAGLLDERDGVVNGHVGGIALGRRSQIHSGLRQHDARFRHPDDIHRLEAVVGQQQRVGVGVANVLGSEDNHASGDEERVLAGHEHTGQPIDRRVGIAAAQRLDERGDDVVMLLALLVVKRQILLDDVNDLLAGERDHAIDRRSHPSNQLNGIQ